MSNNKIFLGMSSWIQLFFLILFAFFGLIITILISVVASSGNLDTLQSTDFLRTIQVTQSFFVFFVPTCLFAYLFHSNPASFLKINKPINLKFLSLAVILIICIQPFINLLGYYNELIRLPEPFAELEEWMRTMEESTKLLTEKLLITDSNLTFLFNIFVIAIVAGITEEFFFRGAIQQIFSRICKYKYHIAIWITAFIFSFIHFQFYGFIPRLILGALLGYIFLWSGNIWIAVIVHTCNNLIGVLLFHYFYGTPIYEKIETIGTEDMQWVAIISIVISGFIIYLLSKEYEKNNTEEIDF